MVLVGLPGLFSNEIGNPAYSTSMIPDHHAPSPVLPSLAGKSGNRGLSPISPPKRLASCTPIAEPG
jgi:hypothetical protein